MQCHQHSRRARQRARAHTHTHTQRIHLKAKNKTSETITVEQWACRGEPTDRTAVAGAQRPASEVEPPAVTYRLKLQVNSHIPVTEGAASQATGKVAAKGCSLITANSNQKPESHFMCSQAKAHKNARQKWASLPQESNTAHGLLRMAPRPHTPNSQPLARIQADSAGEQKVHQTRH